MTLSSPSPAGGVSTCLAATRPAQAAPTARQRALPSSLASRPRRAREITCAAVHTRGTDVAIVILASTVTMAIAYHGKGVRT